jgi:hypothetical protein
LTAPLGGSRSILRRGCSLLGCFTFGFLGCFTGFLRAVEPTCGHLILRLKDLRLSERTVEPAGP